MIVSADGTIAVSNLGWIDGGSIWTFLVRESRSRQTSLSDSRWLSIIQGTNDHFALVHHGEGNTTRVTAHSFADAAHVISSVELGNVSAALKKPHRAEAIWPRGNSSVWAFLPKAYIVRVDTVPFLLLVNENRDAAQLQALPWYEQSYDTMYQGILGVTEVPGSQYLLISVQRDSNPVLYDPTSGNIVKRLELAARIGNPQLFFRRGASELWASDYDTMVRVHSTTWKVLDSLKLQEGRHSMARSFIGSYCFDAEENLCAVARPFSGDVVAIDPTDFTVILRAETGAQPQDVGLLRDNYVVARDWKTGKLLQGMLKPT